MIDFYALDKVAQQTPNSQTHPFSVRDVLLLASWVADGWVEYDNYRGDVCQYCTKEQDSDDLLIGIHSADCPVLIARDLLTGFAPTKKENRNG